MRRTKPSLASSFVAKACTASFGSKETGGTGLQPRKRLQSHFLIAYYFGHPTNCNFFFAKGIGSFHFPPFERADRSFSRSCSVRRTTRSISSQGAGLPVQISN